MDSDEALPEAGGAAVPCALPSRNRAVREETRSGGADIERYIPTPLEPQRGNRECVSMSGPNEADARNGPDAVPGTSKQECKSMLES